MNERLNEEISEESKQTGCCRKSTWVEGGELNVLKLCM